MNKTALILAALLAAAPAWAFDDHDRARRAVEDGKILPLRELLSRAEKDYPGQLLEAELEDGHGAMVYELKILGTDGRMAKLIYDAATGELLKVKRRGDHR